MKVYMAGKISKNDWRHDIVGPQLRCADASGDWVQERIQFGGGFIYTGPFFVGCDHGCAHSMGEHGVTVECGQPAYNNDHCSPVFEQQGRRPWDITNSAHIQPPFNADRVRLFNKCRAAIDDSDFVFAWLDDKTAFGTLWELGYALGKGVTRVVAMPRDIDLSDLWFSIYGATHIGRCESAPKAFRETWGLFEEKILLRKCESPIETAILVHLIQAKPTWADLHAQYETDGYRLDFAVIGNGRKVAIECDGHAYHERTKEQAKHDRRRDRKLQASGWFVARFTGSEIHANAKQCALDALSYLSTPAAAG